MRVVEMAGIPINLIFSDTNRSSIVCVQSLCTDIAEMDFTEELMSRNSFPYHVKNLFPSVRVAGDVQMFVQQEGRTFPNSFL